MDSSHTSSFSSRLYRIGKRTVSRSLTIFLHKGIVSAAHDVRQTQRMTNTASPSQTTHLTIQEKKNGRQALLDFMNVHPRTATTGSSGNMND